MTNSEASKKVFPLCVPETGIINFRGGERKREGGREGRERESAQVRQKRDLS